ncbi:uncharacterized protein MYCFIDRAFT_206403 [Pseudocercospora fijiensis CIRAD86]|uniref:Uncharacterized protein n=1 Tax=Pseudocercospora fijiensis (strain CIRAD86) TaxID=383855 RepID=N1QD19_PSEFD|nr:uncharacterized protein MYCFIDRAFT_206403 [Pseudocercospora fijiensis CIRAD86]EME89613.1 hypothetical protein MYCFIDRAFT_206403 [Pseudocercospora fijiensis CIRAD86]
MHWLGHAYTHFEKEEEERKEGIDDTPRHGAGKVCDVLFSGHLHHFLVVSMHRAMHWRRRLLR